MKKSLIIAGICTILVIIVYLQFNSNRDQDPRGNLYAGSKACTKCHGSLYNSYLHTAHYLASNPATENTVHGSFAKGSNIFKINEAQKIVMEKLNSGLFQSYYLNGKLKERHRFDIVFGGVKGETYLYWKGHELYQLPLSYFTRQHQWSTSPGYGYNFLDFSRSRLIGRQCLECHASFINTISTSGQSLTKGDQFDKATLVYHIDCERCHGPGEQHVAFQNSHPEIKNAQFITSYNQLNRIQKIDMCAVCHSGKPSQMLRSSFDFLPGDTFAKFKMPEFIHRIDTSHLDVHGNQLQLLQSSKCYVKSIMTCTTCHDVHQNSRGNDALYTQKCLNCHNIENHPYNKQISKLSRSELKTNCISCHMPALPTSLISVQVANKVSPSKFFVHTHHIAVYPEEVKKILAAIGK